MQKFIFNIFVIFLYTCQLQINSDIEKEIDVINDIFPELAQELPIYHVNEIIPPPPPAPIYNDKLEIVGYDSTTSEKAMLKYKKEVEERKKLNIDTTYLVIAISDTLISRENYSRDLERIKSERSEYDELISIYRKGNKEKRKIGIDKLRKFDKYKLIYSSELSREKHYSEYQFEFGGELQFSRIYFNTENNRALFYCSYYCGRDCGSGNMIFLKKSNNKWIIEETQMLWIS